jgi:hypothetical protein
MPREEAGIWMEGNVKDMEFLKQGDKTLLLYALNNGEPGVYELKRE